MSIANSPILWTVKINRLDRGVKKLSSNVFNGPITGCRKAQVTKVDAIETVSVKGEGTDDNPYKLVATYWSLDGKFLFETILTEK